MTQSPALTIVALMNAMIGGTILVLPVICLQSGILPTIITIVIMGFVNEISCRLCINHLSNDPDLPVTLTRHSNGVIWYSRVYNILLFFGNMLVCMLYFELIVIQWQTLTGSVSKIIPSVNAVAVLIFIGLLKYFKFGTKMLGYGFVSIASYLVFLIYVLASAPKGSNEIPVWTWNFNQILNALATAFSIQSVFVPIIKKCEEMSKYNLIILLSFLIGGSVYTFIAYAGAFGIVNRTPVVKDPQTIQEFFSYRDPPVMTLAALYLVHLYSALPQYLLIGKKRFLNLFEIEEVEKFTWQQTVVVVVALSVCFIISLFDVQLSILLAINGSLVAFFYTYLVPVYIHTRCYYAGESHTHDEANLIEMQKSESYYNAQKTQNSSVKEQNNKELQLSQTEQSEGGRQSRVASKIVVPSICVKTFNPWKRTAWLVTCVFMIAFGLFVLAYTIYTMVMNMKATANN